ncbi:RHS repeat domain-containing protein [Chryseobacterium sp. 7]|uniref:RHS repeat domain-containing protein n=1 Tax=Chryseobacterium sp. 7 TaxID=2035214 RepID=UPI000EB437CF|nr:RHS repeat-associated core domain-containing protein [Chryseobacterium sp. 7]
MRLKGQWLYTKYDQFGRVAYTGIKTGLNTSLDVGLSRVAEQTDANTFGSNSVDRGNVAYFYRQGMGVYYGSSDLTYPKSPTWVTLLTLNYYDSYPGYDFNPAFPANTPEVTILTGTPTTDGRSTKGLPVMSFVKNIEDDNWTKNYTYYDQKGRAIGSHSINYLGGYTHTESRLDFAGLPQQTITKHKRLNTDAERVITENFEYDNQNRLLVHKHRIDNNPEEVLVQNSYNELSQLVSKKVGGTLSSPLQNISYAYNIRGWMTKINDPKNLGTNLFGYEIKYNKVEGLEVPNTDYPNQKVQAKYNGNIAEVDWKTATDSNGNLRRYGYVYDTLNRLTAGFYQKDTNPSGKEYNELFAYDLNGNITNLIRTQEVLSGNTTAFAVDNLIYSYTGNRLDKVADAYMNPSGYPIGGNEITYDSNGNMMPQLDKGISSIQYNYLNLPEKVTQNAKLTDYLYRADGVKIRKVFGTETTDYLDGFQYTDSVLKFFPTAEGYFNVETGKHVYNYTDHLGNVRLSYAKNGAGTEIIEESNYYPFGLKHEGYNVLTGNLAYKYKYNRKELQETGMYDYGWRQYMPDIGRWMQSDPLIKDLDFTFDPNNIDDDDDDEVGSAIETTLGNGGGIFNPDNLSPYSYGYNNPIKFDDPDGRCPTCIVGALVGAATEYGLQVAANYLDPEVKNKWTDNISLSSIALSAVEGGLTQGSSALRKAAIKTTVMIAKNTVEVNTTKGAKMETNFRNVAKNTLIDAAAGGITKKIGGLAKTAKLGKIEKLATKVNLNSNAKAKSFVQKITGFSSRTSNNISKKLDIKAVSKQLSNGVKNFTNKTVENSTNAATKNKVDKVKDMTND